MKINDLRVGNLVRLKNRTDFYAIVADIYANGGVKLTLKFKDGDSDTDTFSVEDLTPILLNERIVLDLGFVLTGIRDGIRIYGMRCGEVSMFTDSFSKCSVIRSNYLSEIKAVHDLQNFWYTQTKQELNVEKLIL